MPFIEHFELLNLLHYDVVETWAARESGSGRKLLLHRYPKTSGLRERLQSLPLEELATILKAGEDGDYFFVVTQDTPDFRRFLNWIDRLSVVEPVAESAAPPEEPGEFTRVFQAPKIAPLRPQTPPAAADEPGEFTRMFKGPAVPPQRPAPAATPPVPAASVQEPGEFTKLFKSPAPETPVASATAPAAPAEPGEFTQMFGKPNLSAPARDASQNPVAAAPKTAAEPGELTRMFKGPTVQPQRPTPPAAGQSPSEFTKLFNSPMPETPLAARLEKPEADVRPAASFDQPGDFTKMFGRPNQNATDWNASANPGVGGGRATDLGAATGIFSKKNVFEGTPPQPTLAGGPSEYTRLFQTGTGSAEGAGPAQGAAGAASAQAEQKAAPPPPAAKKQTQSVPTGLIVILAAIVVVAIALILYFVIKR
jgi:hypothetical protein